MEIKLSGFSCYNIPGWDGTIDVKQFKAYQYKRVGNSGTQTTLFRKLLKVFKSPIDSPVELPKELNAGDLSLNDFIQCFVGSVANVTRARQKTFTCPNEKCRTENPRGIDILSVFIPSAPVIEGGRLTDTYAINGEPTPITVSYTKISDFIGIQEYLNTLYTPVKDEAEYVSKIGKILTEKYGDIFYFGDAEDISDFYQLLDSEYVMLARCLDIPSIAGNIKQGPTSDIQYLEEKIRWLFRLSGSSMEQYVKISQLISDLSPSMNLAYKDKCSKCGTEIVENLNPAEYFFDTP